MRKAERPFKGTPPHPDRLVVHHYTESRCAPSLVTHVEHVLAYVVDGASAMDYGEAHTAPSGSFIVIPSGVPHRSLPGPPSERWAVGFCASCLAFNENQPLMAPFAHVRRGAMPIVPVPRGQRRTVVRLFRELQEELGRNAPESPALARARLTLLFGELVRARPIASSAPRPSSLGAEALTYIQLHALEGISLADVARAVGRTPAHVAATVKKDTGYTVGEWIKCARLAEAAARLVHTDATLDAITERAGWRDKTHFIRQFKSVYGQSPAAWRRTRRRHP